MDPPCGSVALVDESDVGQVYAAPLVFNRRIPAQIAVEIEFDDVPPFVSDLRVPDASGDGDHRPVADDPARDRGLVVLRFVDYAPPPGSAVGVDREDGRASRAALGGEGVSLVRSGDRLDEPDVVRAFPLHVPVGIELRQPVLRAEDVAAVGSDRHRVHIRPHPAGRPLPRDRRRPFDRCVVALEGSRTARNAAEGDDRSETEPPDRLQRGSTSQPVPTRSVDQSGVFGHDSEYAKRDDKCGLDTGTDGPARSPIGRSTRTRDIRTDGVLYAMNSSSHTESEAMIDRFAEDVATSVVAGMPADERSLNDAIRVAFKPETGMGREIPTDREPPVHERIAD